MTDCHSKLFILQMSVIHGCRDFAIFVGIQYTYVSHKFFIHPPILLCFSSTHLLCFPLEKFWNFVVCYPPFRLFLCVLPYRHLVSYYLVIVACGENPEYLAAPDQLRSHTRAGRLQFRQLYLIDWVIRGRIGIGIGFNPLRLEVFRVSMRC